MPSFRWQIYREFLINANFSAKKHLSFFQPSDISHQPSAISFHPLKVSQEKFAKHLEVRLRIRIFAAVVLKRMRALRRSNV